MNFETTEMVFENVLDEAEKESNWRTVESEECDNETMDTVTDETEETKDVTTNQEMLPIDVEMQIQEEIVAEEAADSTVLIPKSYAIPYMSQADYADVPYGKYGTIKSSGCGIVCLAMVASHFKEELVDPAELAKQFGRYNTAQGSSWSLFEDAAETLELNFQEQTGSWSKVREALENNQVVICSQGPGIFTNGGHYIVLSRLKSDGKVIVLDPNSANVRKNSLADEFCDGFEENQITKSAKQYWIFTSKY